MAGGALLTGAMGGNVCSWILAGTMGPGGWLFCGKFGAVVIMSRRALVAYYWLVMWLRNGTYLAVW